MDKSNKSGKDEEEQRLKAQITKSAEDMQKLVDEKPMGLPEIYKQQIKEFTDQILSDPFSTSIQDIDIFSDLRGPASSSSSRASMEAAEINRRGKDIANIGRKSREILNVLKNAKNKTGENQDVLGGTSQAAEHLEKMVKRLHCRHRKLIRLAEEIIAKRWKLANLTTLAEGNSLKSGGGEMSAGEFTDKKRRSKSRKKKKARKKKARGSLKSEELKTLYTNPLAKLQDVGKRCGSGPDSWKGDDPLVKALNKVGTAKVQKCVAVSAEDDAYTELKPRKKKDGKKDKQKTVTVEKNVGEFPDPRKPTFEAHIGKSALTIFVSNYSKMTVAAKTSSVEGRTHYRESLFTLKVDRSTLTNEFVDLWKRRSYAVGIILIIMTALLQCVYLCGPRMGDNYVTYAMVEAISGVIWAAPTGIYGLIFLGYLFGGMAVIKTAAAVEHNQTVKQYIKERRKKFYLWYGLALYYLGVWVFRAYLWYTKMESTDAEIREVFQSNFYYNQLPSRLLYTQFLLLCCGANGPGDYPEGDTIGWPKSCYTKVDTYDEYFKEPKPIEYGCSIRFYVYTTMAMSVISVLVLLNWLLILIYPVYLYVYELFICMRSKEPDPWLVQV